VARSARREAQAGRGFGALARVPRVIRTVSAADPPAGHRTGGTQHELRAVRRRAPQLCCVRRLRAADESQVLQLVCSPVHNDPPKVFRAAFALSWAAPIASALRWLAARRGISPDPVAGGSATSPHRSDLNPRGRRCCRRREHRRRRPGNTRHAVVLGHPKPVIPPSASRANRLSNATPPDGFVRAARASDPRSRTEPIRVPQSYPISTPASATHSMAPAPGPSACLF
jgi:hypothetical protein